MSEKNQTALNKMQQIANRLISNTPELSKMLDSDSQLRPKRPNSPNSKKNNKLGTSNQTLSHLGKTQLSSSDIQQKCKELVAEVQTWKEKSNSLEEEIVIVKQRFVEREIQYRKIIEQLQDQLKSKSALDNSDRNRMQQIGQLHKEILGNIGTIQDKTSQILTEQESDIRRFFHKKINEIKQKFKEDKISKTEKDQEYQQKEKQMMSELDWIKNIAHKIDLENQTIMKKYSSLRSEFEIQEKDRDLLLREILMKKKENAVLKSQVEQYEKLLNQVSREMEENDSAGSASELLNSRSKLHQNSRTRQKDTQFDLDDSRVDPGIAKRYETTIGHLNNVIAKEHKKVRELKGLYMKGVNSKSQLELIIRKLVEDVRESIIELERDKPRKGKKDEFDISAREQLLERILTNEKILTLIYDKTFYASQKPFTGDQEIPKELSQILENQEDEGFH